MENVVQKTIAGMKSCTSIFRGLERDCNKCTYVYNAHEDYGCANHLMYDALNLLETLLKERRPRVLTLEEVKQLKGNDVVWLEDYDKEDVIPGIVLGKHDYSYVRAYDEICFLNNRNISCNLAEYNSRFRCWTRKPTDEQKKEVKWDARFEEGHKRVEELHGS